MPACTIAERDRADGSSPSGNPSQAAQISARRTQSADIGDLEPAERSPGQRAHSYAADDIVNAKVSDGQSSKQTSLQVLTARQRYDQSHSPLIHSSVVPVP